MLTSKQRRAEYDDYLDQTRRNRTMAALLEQILSDVPAVVVAFDGAPGERAPPPTSPARHVEADQASPESVRSRRAFGGKLGSNPMRRAASDGAGVAGVGQASAALCACE